MGINTALANALTGLNASARAADVVSANVANAMTPGFAKRALVLSAQTLGGNGAGVKIEGVARQVNGVLLADRRIADAQAGNTDVRATFLERIERRIGVSDQEGSLAARYANLDSALIEAASRPDSEARLQVALTAAQDLTDKFAAIARDIQQARSEADTAIAREVETLNESLRQIDRLNTEIVAQRSSGRDATALMDQRQMLVDRVSAIVPVREAPREGDQIALFTTGGAVLLEGNPVEIGFSRAGVISADMTLASGALSGLTINGQAAGTGERGVIGGGTLAAHFAVRDSLGPEAQAQLDALARDLVARFADPAVDPTLTAGQPGLFTDAGTTVDPLNEAGLASRLRLNAQIDPERGGALWRLRDGLGATSPGAVGESRLLHNLASALGQPRVPDSGNFIGAARSAAGLANDVLSGIGMARQGAEEARSFAASRQATLQTLELEDGVDTDAEMQMLMLVEQAFAANARVISTIDDLVNQIIRM